MDAFSNKLTTNLDLEQQAAAQLLSLLRQEQSCLVDNEIDGLATLTEEKTKVVAQMTSLATGRHRALAFAGFEAGENGMQEWIRRNPGIEAVNKSWTELLALAQLAKELNRNNGLLINKHLGRNRNALDVLQGKPQGSNLYGPNGQASSFRNAARGVVIG
ncbi:N/A [soil metagenome]